MSIKINDELEILERMQRTFDNWKLEDQMKDFFAKKKRQKKEKRRRIINYLFYFGLREKYLSWYKKQSYYVQAEISSIIGALAVTFFFMLFFTLLYQHSIIAVEM